MNDYAAKSAPLRALLKTNVTFLWDDACQQAFECLKSDLVPDSCLRYPDLQRPFILTTDWSKVAVGAVFSQQQPVNYNDPDSELYNTVHDRILQAQRRNAERQTSRRSASGKGGRKLAVDDLAYLLTTTEGFKTKVDGPFVVCALSEWHVELRTSAQYLSLIHI